MAQREALAALTADLSGLVAKRCRDEGVTGGTQRLAIANQVMNEFVLIARKVSQNLDAHGEVTAQTYREMRETVRDLAVNVLGRTDVPSDDAGTSCVAD